MPPLGRALLNLLLTRSHLLSEFLLASRPFDIPSGLLLFDRMTQRIELAGRSANRWA